MREPQSAFEGLVATDGTYVLMTGIFSSDEILVFWLRIKKKKKPHPGVRISIVTSILKFFQYNFFTNG